MQESPRKIMGNQFHIQNDRQIFGLVLLAIFSLCVAIYPLRHSFIGRVFAADFGILSNLTLLLLLLCVWILFINLNYRRQEIKKTLIQKRAVGLKVIAPDLAMISLCIFLCGESLNWFLPYLDTGDSSQPFMTFNDILAAGFREVPDKIELSRAMMIAAARLILILAPLYLLAFLTVHYQTVIKALQNADHANIAIYGSAFIVLFVLALLMAVFEDKSTAIFERGSSLGQTVCLSLYLLKTKKLPLNSESSI